MNEQEKQNGMSVHVTMLRRNMYNHFIVSAIISLKISQFIHSPVSSMKIL